MLLRLPLYENVAEVEKYQHSERLATCQYRIFSIQVGDDQSRNLKAATLFLTFLSVDFKLNKMYMENEEGSVAVQVKRSLLQRILTLI